MDPKNKFIDFVVKPLKRLWAWTWSLMDCNFKRMCILTSLHAVLLKCNDSESDKIKDLNDKFKLARDVNALRLPTLFGPVLWKKVLPIERIDVTTERYIQRLMRMTPCWLKYGDEEKFKQDLRELINYCNRQHYAS